MGIINKIGLIFSSLFRKANRDLLSSVVITVLAAAIKNSSVLGKKFKRLSTKVVGDMRMRCIGVNKGSKQVALFSPINIDSSSVVKAVLGHLRFSYQTYTADKLNIDNKLRDGVTLTIPSGSFFEDNDKRYELLWMNCYVPSEHKIDNKHHDAEIHFVHSSEDEFWNTIIGVFVNVSSDINDNFEVLLGVLEGKINGSEEVDLLSCLPQSQKYYRFSGALTSDNSIDNIEWYLMQEPILISSEQLSRLKSISGAARPIQTSNGRLVVQGI